MLRRLILGLLILAAIGATGFWLLTMPERLSSEEVAQLGEGDAVRGRRIFFAGGCGSCHARAGATGEAVLELGGGRELVTPFGTFVTPNISSDPDDGIGRWTAEDLGNAMLKGVAPDGSHFYPAFPYTSYARMKPADIGDLYAFLKTVPAVKGKAAGHRLGFPFNVRRGLGLWKLLFLSDKPVVALAADAPQPAKLGQYLAEGPGHCGECHTPRNLIGGLDKGRWLAGAVAAEGQGTVPNITTGEGGIGSWSEKDIAYFFETGFTPDFDSVGGSMAEVQRNLAELTPEDREGIAAYLKAVPPHPNGYPAHTVPAP